MKTEILFAPLKTIFIQKITVLNEKIRELDKTSRKFRNLVEKRNDYAGKLSIVQDQETRVESMTPDEIDLFLVSFVGCRYLIMEGHKILYDLGRRPGSRIFHTIRLGASEFYEHSWDRRIAVEQLFRPMLARFEDILGRIDSKIMECRDGIAQHRNLILEKSRYRSKISKLTHLMDTMNFEYVNFEQVKEICENLLVKIVLGPRRCVISGTARADCTIHFSLGAGGQLVPQEKYVRSRR